MHYYELWMILCSWKNEFSLQEFSRIFSSPDPRKVLHDMAKKGFLERTAHGMYKVKSLENYVRAKNNVSEGYELLKRSDLSYALTGVDGVFLWTKGGYNLDRFFGYYPIYLKVLKRDVEEWKDFFARNGKRAFLEEKRPMKTLYGIFYVMYPEPRLRARKIEGLRVEPIDETLGYALERRASFEPALEMMDKKYKLGLDIAYGE